MKSFKGQLVLGVLIIVCLIFFPTLFLGNDYYLIIHDNLDSEVGTLTMLKESGLLLKWSGDTIIPNVFNGLPRWYIACEFSFIRVLFLFFEPFWAYVVNSAFVRVIGFCGILLIARDHTAYKFEDWRVFGVALVFSMLPIYPIYGSSVMGQTMVLWAVLNLQKSKNSAVSMLVLFLFPFYSHIALIGPFTVLIIFLYGFWIFYTSGKLPGTPYILGLVLLVAGFMLANKSMILAIVFGNEQTHRIEIVTAASSVSESLRLWWTTLTEGHYHAASLFGLSILLFGLAIVYFSQYKKAILGLFIAIVAISALYGFSSLISATLGQFIPAFKTFQVNRFIFFLPLLFFMIIFLAAIDKEISKWLLYGFVIFQFFMVFTRNQELYPNYVKVFDPHSGVLAERTTFKEFYALAGFEQLKNDISEPLESFRVVSLGIFPSVAQFNGFYTLDSYQNLYPLEYKRAFRSVISSELAKDDQMRKYYDEWGHRCYFYSAELWGNCRFMCTNNADPITNLQFNSKAFTELGGRYIISAVEIKNASDLGLQLAGTYEAGTWNVRLYKLQ
jgi:hypothetical protein